MDNKSVEILKELKQYLSTGALGIEEFPKQDLLGMVHAEYERLLKAQLSNLGEYIAIYDLLMGNELEERNVDRLTALVDELIIDLQSASIAANSKMDRLRQASDPVIVKRYQQRAKAAYDKYLFQSMEGELAFHGKGVIYTVITGNYDVLREPEYVDSGFDYVCFTDNRELHSDVWSMCYIENPEGLDMIRLARKYKILCHQYLSAYSYSIYVDGKIQIIGSLKEYAEKYSKGSSMLCFPHHVRECAYEEAQICMQQRKDVLEVINSQMKGYRQEGYPENYGLTDTACLVRRHDDRKLQSVMECWWREVREKSRRDQLSIGYACWKNDFHYDLSDLFIYQNAYIRKRRESEKPY